MSTFGTRIAKALTVGATVLALGLSAGVASATPPGPPEPVKPILGLSPQKGAPGTLVHVQGRGFVCATSVDLFWEYTRGDPIYVKYLGSVRISGGAFHSEESVPADATPGWSAVIAKAPASSTQGSSCEARARFEVCFCRTEADSAAASSHRRSVDKPIAATKWLPAPGYPS